jgi:hypothetical protein
VQSKLSTKLLQNHQPSHHHWNIQLKMLLSTLRTPWGVGALKGVYWFIVARSDRNKCSQIAYVRVRVPAETEGKRCDTLVGDRRRRRTRWRPEKVRTNAWAPGVGRRRRSPSCRTRGRTRWANGHGRWKGRTTSEGVWFDEPLYPKWSGALLVHSLNLVEWLHFTY